MIATCSFFVGCWFGMVVMALVRVASDREHPRLLDSQQGISLKSRNGERVLLHADGSRRVG